MTCYVKLLGSTDMPMPNDWWSGGREDLDDEVRFPARPVPAEITPGDELVYYAVGGFKRVFATARIKSTAEIRTGHPNSVIAKRWPYAADAELDPSTRLKYVSSGPELAAVGPGLQDQVRQGVSHFEIGRAELQRAVQLLRRAKTEEDRKLMSGWRPS